MSARKLLILLAFIVFGVFIALYSTRWSMPDSRIAQCVWKSGGASPLGDVLIFKDASNQFKSGVIYREGVAVGKVTQKEFRWFADNIITVESSAGRSGDYFEKGCIG
jgi:hypothetical protein